MNGVILVIVEEICKKNLFCVWFWGLVSSGVSWSLNFFLNFLCSLFVKIIVYLVVV